MQPPNQNNGAVAVRLNDLTLTTVAKGAAGVAVRHPVISLSWVAGLFLAIMATGFTPAPQAMEAYSFAVEDLKFYENELLQAQYEYDSWNVEYHESKGWFWQCDDHCQENYKSFVQAREDLRGKQRSYDGKLAEAKSHLGIFSTLGVAEARDLFWRRVAGGREFARRSTLYDAIFAGIGSMRRDSSMAEYVMTMAVQVLWNMSIGAVGALVTFLWSVWGVIATFQPSAVVALLFFMCASLAAGSVIATFFLGLGAAGAGAVVGMVQLAKAQGTLEAGDGTQQRQRLQGQQQYRSHRD
ncbi:hypothetical protein JKP88DRAFT_220741 [Tribonema minus]|uniref:Uncharacterized protein n=1 Tax=Tribonema minus TaxID=303371 RepID=A0A835Z0D4_9STRA|nr:hypothetical protein JKP88DRAFT_220741 [Tribonema minus]